MNSPLLRLTVSIKLWRILILMLTRLWLRYGLQTFDSDRKQRRSKRVLRKSNLLFTSSTDKDQRQILLALGVIEPHGSKLLQFLVFFLGGGGVVAIFRIVPSPLSRFEAPTQWILDPPLRMLTTLNRRGFKIHVESIEYHWINNQILNVLILLKLFSACLYFEFFLRTL